MPAANQGVVEAIKHVTRTGKAFRIDQRWPEVRELAPHLLYAALLSQDETQHLR